MVGHDDPEPSYYFTVDDDYDDRLYDWTQEQWIARCLSLERRGMEHYGFMSTPVWIWQGINLLATFDHHQQQRVANKLRLDREHNRGRAGISC